MLGSEPTARFSVPTAGGPDSPGSGAGGGGTLAEIYAFGLADNPSADNVFHMPEGDWSFPGLFQTVSQGYGIGYIDDTATAGTNNPWNYVRLFGHAGGLFNTSRAYNAYSI